MKIPFTKAHGAHNDFLLTWEQDAPQADRVEIAKAICARHTGVGADGWIVVSAPSGAVPEASIQLYNSDGSTAELSGNGTRCAAALLMHNGFDGNPVRICTGAGIKTLRLLQRDGLRFQLEMNMGSPEIRELHHSLPLSTGERDVTLVWVGNPQCAVRVSDFDFDWRATGAAIERHPRFPGRTNVSFVRAAAPHRIEVRFWERGAGETMSSGTGSTGAAAAAIALGLVSTPVTVETPAGPIEIRAEQDYFLVGPAELVAEGVFFK